MHLCLAILFRVNPFLCRTQHTADAETVTPVASRCLNQLADLVQVETRVFGLQSHNVQLMQVIQLMNLGSL